MRYIILSVAASTALCATPSIVLAQGLGVGGRMAWIKADAEADVDSVRFTGGQLRLVSSRWGLEVAMDRHTESFDDLNQKSTQTQIQGSLLLRLGAGRLSPFLLGGPGWYRAQTELLEGPDDARVETREFGWHAGGGLEILAGRHLGIHGDYRHTFLDSGEEDDDEGLIGSLMPGYRGSMWTVGATIYF